MVTATIGELERIWRNQILDTVATEMFSHEQFVQWLADAQEQACRRKPLLLDYSTPEICHITLAQGNDTYSYSPLILQINYVELDDGTVLQLTDYGEMNDFNPGWQHAAQGIPKRYLLDEQTQFMRVYPKPNANAVLLMTVQRLPKTSGTADQYYFKPEDTLEIPKANHVSLLDWVTFRAYTTKDPDTDRKDLGIEAYGRFESHFGPLPGSEKETRSKSGYPRQTNYGQQEKITT